MVVVAAHHLMVCKCGVGQVIECESAVGADDSVKYEIFVQGLYSGLECGGCVGW